MTATRLAWLGALLGLMAVGNSPLLAGPPVAPASSNDPVLRWNEIALRAMADDHSGTFGPAQQGGPTRGARALAIVHVAIFDAVNAIVGGHEPYIPVAGLPPGTLENASVEAAVAQAAHDTLAALYLNQQAVFEHELDKALQGVPRKRGRDEGSAVGATAAMNILLERSNDGGDTPDVPFDFTLPALPGHHRPDPLNPNQGLHVPEWGKVMPFAMDSVLNFHAPAPPHPDSAVDAERLEYAMAYDQVMRLGGDGIVTPTERTPEQTDIGLFWGYDGSIGLGVPPRLYNQVARVIAKQEHNTVAENARLFALLNIAQADAGIASWYSKYVHDFWRPVVAIQAGDDDGNEFTAGDPGWIPLGAPASNQSNGGVDFTPPFPAYTSGHATFGAATFRTLAHFYGTDEYEFQLRSDELHGATTDSQGNHRRTAIRQFSSFSQAARENADSRIYLGIHWIFDADVGIAVGSAVADYAFQNHLQPVP
jgi:PAP2 superfamily